MATDSAADRQLLVSLLPLLALCLLGRPVLQYGREQLSVSASQQVRLKLRQQVLQHIADAGPGKNQYGSDGSISTKLLEQVDALDGFISRYYVQRYLVLITPLLLVGATFIYSPLAAVILLVTAPLVPLFMILLGNAAAGASQRQLQQLSRKAYQQGQTDLLNLLSAEDEYLQIQRQLIDSQSQYHLTLLQLERLSGQPMIATSAQNPSAKE